MTGDRFDDHLDPDDCGPGASLLLFALVALVAWLILAACAETAQTVIP